MKSFFSVVLMSVCFFCFIGCGPMSTMDKQAQAKVERVNGLMTNQPTPQVSFSMDRYILSERLTRFNDPNKMCYLYLVFCDGTWLQTTIIGKMSSTSKRLTDPMLLHSNFGNYWDGPAPDEMGTWGSSDPAHVGITTLGSLIETGGFISYIYSETPLTFKNMTKPIAEMTVVASAEERAALLQSLESLRKAARQ